VQEPNACTKCGTATAHTPDWCLWPWPDGAWLCSRCNDERHELEDFNEVERAVVLPLVGELVPLPVTAPPSFTCPDCGMVSYNPNDISNRYCGACCRFVDDPRR
jgi:hypothetical protein